MSIASRPDARRVLIGIVTTAMLAFAAAPIHFAAAADNKGASAIAALDAIPAGDWLKQSSGALLDRVIAASSKESLDAAAASDPRAQALVGSAHLSGLHGYAKSEAEAVKFYRLAADSNPVAQNNLGSLLVSGVANGGKPAPAEAAEMFRRAAKQGHPVAQANLGGLYADGVGVEKDLAKAKEYLALAAAQGNAGAKDSLDTLKAREAAELEAEKWKRLEAAAATGNADAVRALAEAYAEIDQKAFDFIKTNQLQAAVNTILKEPDRKKSRIAEMADDRGMTALHWAVTNRNGAAVRWLLDKGADPEPKDDQGRTPLKIALDNQDTTAMTLLVTWGARPRTVLPGHDDELKAFTKTSDIVDFMIKTAAADKASAAELQKKCDAKDWAACDGLAYRYLQGQGVAKDVNRGMTILARACEARFAGACTSLGGQHASSDDVPKDLAKAASFFARACDLNDAIGCEFLAAAHESGEGVRKDEQRAKDLYAKACRLGNEVSCVSEAIIAPQTKSHDAAVSSATELDARCKAGDPAACDKACAGGNGPACHALAEMYRTGQGVKADAARTAALLDKACKLGDLHVCPAQGATAPSKAAATAPAPLVAAPPAVACKVAKVLLGIETVAGVERDIKSRGGTPSVGGGGRGKHALSTTSGDYSDAGPDVMAVNYDFDASDPAGKLIAVTIVRKTSFGAPYARLAADRKTFLATLFGPLKQKSATELAGSSKACQLSLFENPDIGYLYEVYFLPN